MNTGWRLGVIAAWIAGVGVVQTHTQVELDRIVVRMGNHVITLSDVRQAMVLKLVEDVGSEAACQRGLENRWLILEEIRRSSPLPPGSESELASRRAAWEQRVGGSAAAAGLLTKTGMNEASLQAWLRDDLRIQAYLSRQFENVPASERGKQTSDWLSRLRQRAQLK